MEIASTEGLPAELLAEAPIWEVINGASRSQGQTSTRLYEDGSLYGYSDLRRIQKGTLPGREKGPTMWRLDARLDEAGVASVVDAIKASGFLQLDSSSGTALDAPSHQWRVRVGGEDHVVQNVAVAGTPAEVTSVTTALQKGIVPGGVPVEQPK